MPALRETVARSWQTLHASLRNFPSASLGISCSTCAPDRLAISNRGVRLKLTSPEVAVSLTIFFVANP